MNEIVKKNRKVCKDKIWITKEEWDKSNDNYGLPNFCFKEINEPLLDKVSYADILVFLANKYEIKEYLEIGVSVLKTFYQMACNSNCNLIAFDLNDKNPCIEIPRDYKYFKGNVLIKDDWKKLKDLNIKHDLIFSDALHDNIGLQAEYDFYIKDHLADKWIIIWDDAFENPVNYIKKKIIPNLEKKYGKLYIKLQSFQEWVRNKYHPILIVSNYNFNLDT
jgi:hypothetical protein